MDPPVLNYSRESKLPDPLSIAALLICILGSPCLVSAVAPIDPLLAHVAESKRNFVGVVIICGPTTLAAVLAAAAAIRIRRSRLLHRRGMNIAIFTIVLSCIQLGFVAMAFYTE